MSLVSRLETNNSNLKAIQARINSLEDGSNLVFTSVEKMNAYTKAVEDTFAIVYGDTYVGTYRYDNGSWTNIGDSTDGQLVMDTLNSIAGTTDQFEGYGGTEDEILEVLNKIGG